MPRKQRPFLPGPSPIQGPRFAVVYDHLRRMIRAGVLQPGDALPTIADLAVRHATSTITIRRAIDELERDGLVHRIQGKGVFIRAHSDPVYAMVTARPGPRIECVDRRLVAATPRIRQVLGVGEQTPLVRIARRHSDDQGPRAYEHVYLDPTTIPEVDTVPLASLLLFEWLYQRHRLRPAGVRVAVRAVGIPDEAAQALGMDPGFPVLVEERVFELVGQGSSERGGSFTWLHPNRHAVQGTLQPGLGPGMSSCEPVALAGTEEEPLLGPPPVV